MSGLAETIRSTVSMSDVCTKYGYIPNSAGYIRCPIHNEKTPSLKIYPGDGGWHCFGCGEGGNHITFVMRIFDIDFRQALIRIANDFGIRPADTDDGQLSAMRRKRDEERRADERRRREYDRRCREYFNLRCVLAEKAPKPGDDQMDPEYAAALRQLPYLDHWFDTNSYKRGDSH